MAKINRVNLGGEYRYEPVMIDITDPKAPGLRAGMRVKVIQAHGCPPPNSFGHAHVALNGKFMGLVHCNSLAEIK